MSQLNLVAAPPPPVPAGIDLRRCDVRELLAPGLEETPALVIADPPWSYDRNIGNASPANIYGCMSTPNIVELLDGLPGARLALWCTWPILPELPRLPTWRWVSGGAWSKSGASDAGHYGPGHHWAGCSEPVLLYTREGSHTDRARPLRNAWVEPPGKHSAKPVGWQRQWLRRWTRPGDLVLDPFAGLGSVAVACALEGRRYLGCEIDPERHAAALSRVAQYRREA